MTSTSEIRELPSGMLIRRIDNHMGRGRPRYILLCRAVDEPVCMDIEIELTKGEFDALWPLSTREGEE